MSLQIKIQSTINAYFFIYTYYSQHLILFVINHTGSTTDSKKLKALIHEMATKTIKDSKKNPKEDTNSFQQK